MQLYHVSVYYIVHRSVCAGCINKVCAKFSDSLHSFTTFGHYQIQKYFNFKTKMWLLLTMSTCIPSVSLSECSKECFSRTLG